MALILGSCSADTERRPLEDLAALGLHSSAAGQEAVDSAIALTNALAAPANRSRVVGAWQRSPASDGAVVLHLVQSEGLEVDAIAQVPESLAMILVSSNWRQQADSLFQPWDSTGNQPDRVAALALALLHEMGHIANSAIPELVTGTGIRVDEIALRAPRPMSHELAADLFAASSILDGSQRQPTESRRLVDAIKRIEHNVDVTNYFANGMHGSLLAIASWDPRRRYADRGYTHPNLNLRFRILAYLVDSSPRRRKSVEEFIEWRQRVRSLPATTPPP